MPQMKSRKVFRIYASLPEEERQGFGLYLASPYFNSSQRLIDFRNLLEQELVLQPDQQLSTAEVWGLLPDVTTEYRANGFDKLCTELQGAINDFLAVQSFREHQATVAHHQLQAYEEHGFDEWIPGMYEGLIEKLGKDLERDPAGLYAHAQMLHTYARHLFRVERMPDISALTNIDRKVNEFYFACKLELAAAVDGYNRKYHSGVTLPYLDIVRNVLAGDLSDYPLLIQAQAHAWLMTRHQDVAQYRKLRTLLAAHAAELPEEEVKSLYRHALNFCLARYNAEEEDFEEESDAMLMILLENGILIDEGRLNPIHMRNVVQLRLRNGLVDWVETFLANWGTRLTHDHNGCALRYNQAVLAFYQGDFSKCLREMETVLRDLKADVYYGIDARVYALMSIFELNKVADWDSEFESRLNALRLYLLRDQKIEETRRKHRLELVKLFRRLLSLQREVGTSRRKKALELLEIVKSLKPSTNREWFERQISGYM